MKKSSSSVESCFSRFKCLRRLVVAVRGRISSCNHPLQRSRGARNTSQNSFHGLEDELKSVRKGRETAWDLASAVLGACFGWLGLLRVEFRAATSRFRAAGVPKKISPKTISTGVGAAASRSTAAEVPKTQKSCSPKRPQP